jgi:hypothetical protein
MDTDLAATRKYPQVVDYVHINVIYRISMQSYQINKYQVIITL